MSIMSEKLEREVFGQTKAGETVYRVVIKGGGLTAKIISWGAVIQDLRLEGHDAPLSLGFEDFDSFPPISAPHPAAAPTASAAVNSRSTARTFSSSRTKTASRICMAAATISPNATGRSSSMPSTAWC
jgi:hypothetical protein